MSLRPKRPERERRSLTGAMPRAPVPEAERLPPAKTYRHPSGTVIGRPKANPVRSRSYLDHVRSRPCCVCSAPPPSDPHHYGAHGTGTKTDDRRTVPLCRHCHDDFHALGYVDRPAFDTRALTREHLLATQVRLLIEWIDRDGVVESEQPEVGK